MSTRKKVSHSSQECANEVRLIGRLNKSPEIRELPSGDQLVTFRLAVERPLASVETRQKVDSVPCSVWAARPRRTASRWEVGDVVEISGAVRCRFFQAGARLGSRVEVEVSSARTIRRARDA